MYERTLYHHQRDRLELMNFINGWELARVWWQSILKFLNLVIPIVLPDGTQFGAKIFFAVIGLLAVIMVGNKFLDPNN